MKYRIQRVSEFIFLLQGNAHSHDFYLIEGKQCLDKPMLPSPGSKTAHSLAMKSCVYWAWLPPPPSSRGEVVFICCVSEAIFNKVSAFQMIHTVQKERY